MKTKEAYLGLDLGGTGAKAGVFNARGRLLGFAQRRITPKTPAPGQAEIPIEVIEAAARDAVREAVHMAAAPIRTFAVVTQGQTFVSLDERDRPLHPAIIWYDSRATDQARRLNETVAAGADAAPKQLFAAIATAPKIVWLREQSPERMRRARRYLLLPDYVAYRLTGQAVTEPNTAVSTGLYAINSATYSAAALKASDIAADQLARILPPGQCVGHLLKERANAWGLSPETMLITGTNDQYAGALGAGNCRPGIISETSGTCLALITLTKRLPHPMPPGLFGGRFPIDPYYFALAFAKTAGIVLDWFREQCAAGKSFEELNRQAKKVPIGCRGLTVGPHFDGMISPRPDAGMRGIFANLTLQHTRADMYRAILEALAFSLRENVAFLKEQRLAVNKIRCIGGGAKNEFWLQMKADVTGKSVEQPAVTESAVLGAAMLAAWGAGAFSSLAETSAAWYRLGRVFIPNLANHGKYEAPYRRYRELTGKTIARPS